MSSVLGTRSTDIIVIQYYGLDDSQYIVMARGPDETPYIQKIIGETVPRQPCYYPNRELIAAIYTNDDWRTHVLRLEGHDARIMAEFFQAVRHSSRYFCRVE